jgi:hypothetical protein
VAVMFWGVVSATGSWLAYLPIPVKERER